MKLGLKETLTLAGLTALSCISQKEPDPEIISGAKTTRANVSATLDPEKSVPAEADVAKGELKGECTPVGQSLQGRQFPMRRGTQLIKTLSDSTCLERLRDGNDNIIYAISGNRKIKFANPNPEQEARIFGQDNFSDLTKLGIALMEEIQAEAVSARENPGKLARRLLRLKHESKPLRVLVEGPMDNCPTYRYRRSMLADIRDVMGGECIWDKEQTTCPMITTATDSSHKTWYAHVEEGEHVIPDTNRNSRPDELMPGKAPTPDEWLGRVPDCPKLDSIINTKL